MCKVHWIQHNIQLYIVSVIYYHIEKHWATYRHIAPCLVVVLEHKVFVVAKNPKISTLLAYCSVGRSRFSDSSRSGTSTSIFMGICSGIWRRAVTFFHPLRCADFVTGSQLLVQYFLLVFAEILKNLSVHPCVWNTSVKNGSNE